MKYPFEEIMKIDATPFIVAPGKKTEVDGYFTNLRVDRDTLPDGYYAYDIRHGDAGGFLTLEENVEINHAGTFLTKTKINLGETGRKHLTCGYTF